MRKPPALPHWNLVIDLPNSVYESVVERHFADHNALLFRLLGLVAGLKTDLMRPPMIKRGNWQDCEVVPFKPIRISRRGVWQFLNKRENICSRIGTMQYSDC